jgi:hypothetical protein
MNVKADKMRYQLNKAAYGLILLGLSLSVVAMFRIITPVSIIPNHEIAIEILINIVLLLVTFLAAERCKFYSKNWAFGSIAIGFVHLLRIFYVPTNLLQRGMLSSQQFIIIALLLVISALLIMFGGYITWVKYRMLSNHMKALGK